MGPDGIASPALFISLPPCDAVSAQERAFQRSPLCDGNFGEHQGTAAFYCRQQHFSRDLPLWLFVFPSWQCLDVFARIAQDDVSV
jgi:hypothetical protein